MEAMLLTPGNSKHRRAPRRAGLVPLKNGENRWERWFSAILGHGTQKSVYDV